MKMKKLLVALLASLSLITGAAAQTTTYGNSGATSIANGTWNFATALPIFASCSGYMFGNTTSQISCASTVPLANLAAQATNTIVGNATSGSAAPTALTIGTCSTSASALTWTTNTGFGCNTSIVPAFANPTASVGLTAVNGSASTAMRSDAAPPISQAIIPTWTGTHTFAEAIVSTKATGTAPFTVASTTQVSNLFATKAATANAWTTARNLAGNSVDGSANVAFANKFIVQGTTDTGLSAAQFLGALGTGLVKNTTTTGVLSIATAGTDYLTSVGLSFTGGLISVGSSPLTANGTIALTVAGTSGGIPYFASTSTWASSALLSSGAIMLGGGAGNPPTTTTTGTGVVTALGVNTGSAGAFVVNGGALGTPSSGTLSSATGLPISTGVSGLGTGIATALAVNTGSAGAPVLFNGAGGTPSSLTLTNALGLPAAAMPALTGSCTTSAGAVATTCEQDGAGTTFIPTLTCASGTLTTSSATGRYKLIGTKLYWASWTLTITTVGTCSGLSASLPASKTAGADAMLVGADGGAGAEVIRAGITSGQTTTDQLVTYNAGNPLVNGALLKMSGVFEVQ